MKQALMALGLAVLVVISVAAARGGAEQAKFKYLIVRLPSSAVEIEFDGGGKGARVKSGKDTPLDSLGREGWELVSASVDGSSLVCFLKAPLESR